MSTASGTEVPIFLLGNFAWKVSGAFPPLENSRGTHDVVSDPTDLKLRPACSDILRRNINCCREAQARFGYNPPGGNRE